LKVEDAQSTLPPGSEIPFYPDSRPLAMEDRPSLRSLFEALQPRVSELTFAGLWLFRHAHGYRLSRIDDSLLVLGQGYDGSPYAFPPMGGDVTAVASRLLSAGLSFYGVENPLLLESLSRAGRVVEDRDNWDYLYSRSDLATLPGNRYHKKKNRINYFLARHDCTVELLGPQHTKACLDFLQEWGRVRNATESSSFNPELEATVEAVRSVHLLGLEGLVALVDGRVRALVIGERLNTDTSVCHFQKSDPFMEGLSQLIDREFNARLFTDCTFVNREQDLGEPGLRAAKLSYHPIDMVRKYRILPA
jgi:hypothetical protein